MRGRIIKNRQDPVDITDMDIKNVLNAVLPLQIKPKSAVDRSIKSESTTDRDANGQQAYQEKQQNQHPPMSEEQFNKSLESIKGLPAVQEHQLVVESVITNGKRFVLIKQADGKLFRRISEEELWTLDIHQPNEKKKGRLISKSA